jgi:hypothetical protein
VQAWGQVWAVAGVLVWGLALALVVLGWALRNRLPSTLHTLGTAQQLQQVRCCNLDARRLWHSPDDLCMYLRGSHGGSFPKKQHNLMSLHHDVATEK